jgi:hypothetical protein
MFVTSAGLIAVYRVIKERLRLLSHRRPTTTASLGSIDIRSPRTGHGLAPFKGKHRSVNF